MTTGRINQVASTNNKLLLFFFPFPLLKLGLSLFPLPLLPPPKREKDTGEGGGESLFVSILESSKQSAVSTRTRVELVEGNVTFSFSTQVPSRTRHAVKYDHIQLTAATSLPDAFLFSVLGTVQRQKVRNNTRFKSTKGHHSPSPFLLGRVEDNTRRSAAFPMTAYSA
jgi:hypothetical protein